MRISGRDPVHVMLFEAVEVAAVACKTDWESITRSGVKEAGKSDDEYAIDERLTICSGSGLRILQIN